MSRVKVINNMPRFKANLYSVMADALNEGARDTLINAKMKAPFQKGGLRSDSQIQRRSALSYWVSFYKEYARFQEFGGTPSRRVKKYTTVGTGAHFLRNAGNEQSARIVSVFRKHAGRARV